MPRGVGLRERLSGGGTPSLEPQPTSHHAYMHDTQLGLSAEKFPPYKRDKDCAASTRYGTPLDIARGTGDGDVEGRGQPSHT